MRCPDKSKRIPLQFHTKLIYSYRTFYPQLRSAFLTLEGQVNEALDNRNLATDSYKEALRSNINCVEALNALLQHGLLTSLEGMVSASDGSYPPPQPYFPTLCYAYVCSFVHSSKAIGIVNAAGEQR